MDLNFLLILSLPWDLNLEYLETNINNLWSSFALDKGKPSQNYTLEIFRQEPIFLLNY